MYIPVAHDRCQRFVNARRRGLMYSPRIIRRLPTNRTVIAIDAGHTVFLLFRWRIDESGLSELMKTRNGQLELEFSITDRFTYACWGRTPATNRMRPPFRKGLDPSLVHGVTLR
jgi:hypothetical protein